MKTGLTIPRSKMRGLVICCRLQGRIVKLYSTGISACSTPGDSTCVILALEKNSTSFTPYMHTRVSEVLFWRERMGENVSLLEDLFHISSEENAADMCTRREARITDLVM